MFARSINDVIIGYFYFYFQFAKKIIETVNVSKLTDAMLEKWPQSSQTDKAKRLVHSCFSNAIATIFKVFDFCFPLSLI
jgi:hypothetical protein